MFHGRKIIGIRVLLASFLSGVAWAGFFSHADWIFILALLSLSIVNAIWQRRHILVFSALVLVFFGTGLWVMVSAQQRLGEMDPHLLGREVQVTGVVQEIIPRDAGYRATIFLNPACPPKLECRRDLHDERIPVMESGETQKPQDPKNSKPQNSEKDFQQYGISVTLPIDSLVQVGNIVELRGVLDRPQDFDPSFSWKSYLARQGITATMENPRVSVISADASWFATLRASLLERLQLLFPHISGSLMAGLILGARASFSQLFLEQLQASGLTHIVAVSGFNISLIVVFMSSFVFRRARRSVRFSSVMLLVVGFVLLAGPSASVVRAAIMGGLALLATSIGRKANAVNMILWASFFMLLYDPFMIFDIGFQLSFLSTLGILLFLPFAEKIPVRNRFVRAGVQALCVTLAAEILLLPVLFYQFGSFSLIAPLSNLLVLWSVPIVMLLGMVALVLSFVPFVSGLAAIVGYVGFVGTKFIEWGVVFSAQMPFAQIKIDSARWEWIVVWYVCIAAVYVWGTRKMSDARIGKRDKRME